MKAVVVRIGYDGEKRPVKFTGTLIVEASNHSYQGPNQNRYHDYELYQTPSGKYRVVDRYKTCWQGESGHTGVSEELTAKEVMKRFPVVGNEAGFDVEEVAEELAPEQAAAAETEVE